MAIKVRKVAKLGNQYNQVPHLKSTNDVCAGLNPIICNSKGNEEPRNECLVETHANINLDFETPKEYKLV